MAKTRLLYTLETRVYMDDDEFFKSEFWRVVMYATKEVSRVAQEEGVPQIPACKFCGSRHVVKDGHKKSTQNWLCRGYVLRRHEPKRHPKANTPEG